MSTVRRSSSRTLEAVERRWLRRVRVAITAALAVLTLATLAQLFTDPGAAFVLVQVLALGVLVVAMLAQQFVAQRADARRVARDAAFTRILSGLSRSVSSEAIVAAIVDELHRAADVDHVVVSRLLPADGVVETTLVASNAGVPLSRTLLPRAVLDPQNAEPDGGANIGALLRGRRPEHVVAEEIARRARQAYGLSHTLAAPLVTDERIVGALVLSRRSAGDWSAIDRRVLTLAAEELSAALARAFAFEEANTKANIDALTGLPNRRYLEDLLSVMGPRRRSGDSLGALMIDIDRFKALNDKYGHVTGDRVLHAVGSAISASVRGDDTPARYGGEEFAVVLRQATAEQAVEVAERIRAAIAAIPPAQIGTDEPVSVSVGAAVSEAQHVDVARLLLSADRALYRAKREGRDRVVLA